jgi:hypothetical protein
MHDLALSRPAVRERVFTEMFAWLDSTINAENTEAQSILT